MLTDFSVVEQRHKAVLDVLEAGAKITDVALRYGVDRKTLYRWVVRYEGQGLGALLVVGKTLGITALTAVGLRLRAGHLPAGVRLGHIVGAGALGTTVLVALRPVETAAPGLAEARDTPGLSPRES